MLCLKICEQRLDVHLFGFPNQQGLQTLHCASQDLVHLQDFAKDFKELDRKEDQCFDQYVARKLRAWFTMFLTVNQVYTIAWYIPMVYYDIT